MAAKMNRRDMLKLFTSGVVGAMVLDPEKLLWVPGEKTIFLPSTTVMAEADGITYSIWQLALHLDGMVKPSSEWREILRTDKVAVFEQKEKEMRNDRIVGYATHRSTIGIIK